MDWKRSRGTTRWIPLEARTLSCPRSVTIAWVSSVHTPVALTTCLARTSKTVPSSWFSTLAPTTRSPLAQEINHADAVRCVGAIVRSSPYKVDHQTGIIHLAS